MVHSKDKFWDLFEFSNGYEGEKMQKYSSESCHLQSQFFVLKINFIISQNCYLFVGMLDTEI